MARTIWTIATSSTSQCQKDFPLELLPDDCGLMRVDAYGGAVLRPAPLAPVKPARRKAVTARYARAAALRLRRLEDPEASIG